MKSILLSAATLSVSLALTSVAAATWYVDDSVSSSGDGMSWVTAFKTIQEGIAAASNSDEVLVKQGTYIESISFGGKNITLRSTDPSDWNIVKSTIIDGNNLGATVTFTGTEDDTRVLSGFTIRNGKGTDGGGEGGDRHQPKNHGLEFSSEVTGGATSSPHLALAQVAKGTSRDQIRRTKFSFCWLGKLPVTAAHCWLHPPWQVRCRGGK